MNTLSWLIYLADVAQGLSGFLTLLTAVLALCAAISAGLYAASFDRSHFTPDAGQRARRICVSVIATFLVVGLLNSILPTKPTIYMIAASELGQQVYEKPGTKELLGDLGSIIRKEIKKLAAPEKEGRT